MGARRAVAADVAAAAAGAGAKAMQGADRFGLGWRTDLATGILSNLDRIDVVEVIADDYFTAARKQVQAVRTLARELPVLLHGVGLGMASTVRVEGKRLDAMARLVETVRPEGWSEHLAFVRGGGLEIGHLAAPPRNQNSVEGTRRNLDEAARRVGLAPWMENVASLVDPPGSVLGETAWWNAVMPDGRALLLDLHNVYTNAVNFGYDAYRLLDEVSLEQVEMIHIAGGKWMGKRMLDDHLHDVPGPVYDLLRYVAKRSQRRLTVILERDGMYPPMEALLQQIEQARAAVKAGRDEHTGV